MIYEKEKHLEYHLSSGLSAFMDGKAINKD